MRICRRIEHDLSDQNTSAMALIVLFLLIFLGCIDKTYATEFCRSEAAKVISVQGIIELRRAHETTWQQAAMHTVICPGDTVRARSHSRAALWLSNASVLRLDQKTSITFPKSEDNEATSLLDLFSGAIHIITRTPRPFKIRTPFVNASVEGTEFFVGLKEDSTEVVVYEGKVSVSNELGSLLLNDHEAAVTYKGQAPRKEIIIRPADAVQWALYYPVILNYWQSGEAGSSALIRQASHLLTVGQADEAKEIIQQVLQLEPNSSHAHALLAIIALVQNEKDQALGLASKAVTLDPESAVGHLALSYTQQAHFEIEAALASVQKALASDPQNALIWARLAELQMSVGYLERALDAAKLAVSLNPDLAKTQTVLGFAHLLQIDTQTAKEIFHRAIALDQADPMPRLGLGLALIREGELEAGRIELEIAASLDPANSLIRSYLGKAYFEEKRYPLASTQFDLAKERDPKDPTPWFYDAIQKQTQNRPVEALRDIQKSIELNNNRAVYRSKFLLDRDEAARGSSLARIFENLGFERRAVMETAKSLSFDPSNHSAHRFLSDAYINIPRHEIARVSELLQAQLLQPINVNPVQPHLAVTDLNIITNTGPSSTGFNEFTPLMERNKQQVVASGVVGGNSTLGDEIVASAFTGRGSISIGQFHYDTRGFKRNTDSETPNNNDQTHNIYNAFMQYAVTPKFNIQAELNTRKTEHGDLLMSFANDIYNPFMRFGIKQDKARIGTRYAISPNQDFILSTILTHRESNTNNHFPLEFGSPRYITDKELAYQTEAQYLIRQEYFNITAGGSAYRVDADRRDIAILPSFLCNIDCARATSLKDYRNDRDNAYIYSNINFPRNINTTLGLSYDSLHIGRKVNGYDSNSFNPKFGLQWDITSNFRFRAAWFETVKSALVASQTVEPTQVAGFNQFFDDTNGTHSRRKGIGFDARISPAIYSGFEISERDLKVPFITEGYFDKNEKANIYNKQLEKLYRAYLYWLPHDYWTIKGDLHFEKLARADQVLTDYNDPSRIETLKASLGLNYFNPNGLFSSLTGTLVRQDLVGQGLGHLPDLSQTANSKFSIFDAVVGYRLPSRRGIISLEGRNLLDEKFDFWSYHFQYNEQLSYAPRFIPDRVFFVKLTLNY